MVLLWASVESKISKNVVAYYLQFVFGIVYIILQVIFFIIFTITFIIVYFVDVLKPGVAIVVTIYILFLLSNYAIISLGFIIFGSINMGIICATESGKKKLLIPFKLKVFFLLIISFFVF
jgi:hypothetical protein